jgi:hypothetical protein
VPVAPVVVAAVAVVPAVVAAASAVPVAAVAAVASHPVVVVAAVSARPVVVVPAAVVPVVPVERPAAVVVVPEAARAARRSVVALVAVAVLVAPGRGDARSVAIAPSSNRRPSGSRLPTHRSPKARSSSRAAARFRSTRRG